MNSRRKHCCFRGWQVFLLFNGIAYVTYVILLNQYTNSHGRSKWIQDSCYGNDTTNKTKVQSVGDVAKFHHNGTEKPWNLTDISTFKLLKDKLSKLKKFLPESDVWQEVIPSSQGRLFVYSAYYDGRLKAPLVRIMATGFRTRLKPVYCVLYSKNQTFINQTKATLKKLPEHHSYKYSAIHILCSLPLTFHDMPDWVAISEDYRTLNSTTALTTLLPVHYYQNGSHQSFAVCVKPMHSGYDRALWLVEFFEMYQVFGVEHFYMYVDQIGPNVRKVLESYKQSGIVIELAWNLDLKSKKEIHTEGIMVSLNDCLYRTMNRYNYTIMVDLDEFIIPAIPNVTYSEILDPLQLNNTGCFIFQNLFFFLYWNNDTKVVNQFNESLLHSSVDNFNATSITLTDLPYLLTVFKTKRLKKAYPYKIRSKFIVRPEVAVVAGNHYIHEYIPGYKNVNVPNKIASTHHYRQLCVDGEGYECIINPSTTDRTAWSYSGKLIPRVFQACKAAFPETKLCPAAPPLQGPPY